VELNPVGDADGAREHLLMNLRLNEGLDVAAYESRWGVAIDKKKIAELAGDDLVVFKDNRLSATERGRLVLNAVIAALAP